MLAAVGRPERAYPAIHIGGTNGKGSVAALLESVLRARGLRTGLYTSPHLCSFRERIRIAGTPISKRALLDTAERLWPAVEREEPSFFEVTTALALEAFRAADVDVAVVEVGLGGRLDATNVLNPTLAVITNIELDHTDLLGATLEQIAIEKAGIIKAGAPAVTAEPRPELLRLLRERAAEVGTRLETLEPAELTAVAFDAGGTSLCVDTARWGMLRVRTPLIGSHQAGNVGLAVKALQMLPAALRPDEQHVRSGVAAVTWPGRLQIEQIGSATWIFDGAHNPAAVEALVNTLQALRPPRPVVVLTAILSDKDWLAMLRTLARAGDALVLTAAPSAPDNRRWDPADAARALALELRASVPPIVEPDFAAALDAAAGRARDGTVLVTGSFHTVGDALAMLGRAPHGLQPDLHLSFRAV